MTILSEIVEKVRERVEERKRKMPVETMELDSSEKRSLRGSIVSESNTPVIGELKRRSPSEGEIRTEFQVSELAESIAEGGAVAISVLTEGDYFGGRVDYLSVVRDSVNIPVLRKDFIVDEYQIYESVEMGADAVLLIAEVLDDELSRLVGIAGELGLETLVEARNRDQVELAVSSGADLIGVNNRDLKSMIVDLSTTEELAGYAPEDSILVSESGIGNRSDVERVMGTGADAVLVGTSIMKSDNVERKVKELVAGD